MSNFHHPSSVYRLSSVGRRQLLAALRAAFPNEGDLAQMVSLGLDEHLPDIAGGATLTDKTYNLISWAEAHGRLPELLIAATDENPSNPDLLTTIAHLAEAARA